MSKGKLRIRIDSSSGSPAGAEAAYILRRLAARAGAYAPGIQESLFYAIAQNYQGSSLPRVEQWLSANSKQFAHLGYNIVAKLDATPCDKLKTWVDQGMGFRAAVLTVDGRTLYKNSSLPSVHAVALVRHDETSGIVDDELEHGVVMVDAMVGRQRFSAVPSTLAHAHYQRKCQTLRMFWAGYS